MVQGGVGQPKFVLALPWGVRQKYRSTNFLGWEKSTHSGVGQDELERDEAKFSSYIDLHYPLAKLIYDIIWKEGKSLLELGVLDMWLRIRDYCL